MRVSFHHLNKNKTNKFGLPAIYVERNTQSNCLLYMGTIHYQRVIACLFRAPKSIFMPTMNELQTLGKTEMEN